MRNIHHTGIDHYVNRYDRHKPRVETTMYVDRDELTLAHLQHLIEKTDNFSENTRVKIHKNRVTVVQESNKPVDLQNHAALKDFAKEMLFQERRMDRSGKPKKDLPPRDSLGRFTKRK